MINHERQSEEKPWQQQPDPEQPKKPGRTQGNGPERRHRIRESPEEEKTAAGNGRPDHGRAG